MTTRIPSKVCDECASPKDMEQVLKLIEFHKYRIEILCDHFGLDPGCWLTEDPTEH